MFQASITNLQHDISILQHYILNRQENGFYDMEKLVEIITKKTFNALESWNLDNLNLLKVNFPAIDLADKKNKIAVQVTTNASPAKIKKTIDKFEKLGLDKYYDKLIIIGFCKNSKAKHLNSNYSVIGANDIIQRLIELGDESKIDEVIQIMRMHSDYGRLHPYNDKDCLEIVLNIIDRNAIKHRMYCEGNYHDMVSGLNEISELISKGQINKKEKSKSIDDFQDQSIIDFLHDVRTSISKITSIVNRNRRPGLEFICLDDNDMIDIDNEKISIVTKSNEIAQKQNIKFKITQY